MFETDSGLELLETGCPLHSRREKLSIFSGSVKNRIQVLFQFIDKFTKQKNDPQKDLRIYNRSKIPKTSEKTI